MGLGVLQLSFYGRGLHSAFSVSSWYQTGQDCALNDVSDLLTFDRETCTRPHETGRVLSHYHHSGVKRRVLYACAILRIA
jgi:hypothetical protein